MVRHLLSEMRKMERVNNKHKTFKAKDNKKIKTIMLMLELNFENENDAKIFYSVLNPEIKTKISRDVNSFIRLEGNQVFISVESSQLSKMRAVMNSYGRLISVIHKIVSVVREAEK